jgi:hypothetical protein
MALNTPVNKVVLGNQTLMDLTSDTVTPETLALGTTAHDASGAPIVGTASVGGLALEQWDFEEQQNGNLRLVWKGAS